MLARTFTDLDRPPFADSILADDIPQVAVSALNGSGIDELRGVMTQQLFEAVPEDIGGPIPFTERQVKLIEALESPNREEIIERLTSTK